MPSLLRCCVGPRPKSFNKQHERLKNGRTERRRCHTAVTTRCGSLPDGSEYTEEGRPYAALRGRQVPQRQIRRVARYFGQAYRCAVTLRGSTSGTSLRRPS
jgi:hypothetical protein